MPEKRVFNLQELATYTHCDLVGNPQHQIHHVADLETATSNDASFLSNSRYKLAMMRSKAGVIFIDRQTDLLPDKNYLISDDPSHAFQKLVDLLYPQQRHPSGFSGIHPSAIIHESAQIGEDVIICPQAVIDEGVILGARTFVGAGVYIGSNTVIGTDCLIHPHVVIREQCIIGNHVIIQPGAIIGSCGFGYITDKQGRHTKLNQVGNVRIEDNVEIGANTTIDRARFKSTIIGQGSKLDNLVQIGHAVILGAHNMIIAQTGIAGSTSTGKNVTLAGQVAVAGHLHLDDEVMVAGKSGVSKSLSTGKYGGIPAIAIEKSNRNQVFLRHIETHLNQIRERIDKLEQAETKR